MSAVKYDTRGNKSIAYIYTVSSYIYITGNCSISGLSNFYIFFNIRARRLWPIVDVEGSFIETAYLDRM